jgi:hypothetical protein
MHTREVRRAPYRPTRTLLIGVAAVAVLLIGALAVVLSHDDSPVKAGTPAGVNASAEEVATSFLQAYGSFDADHTVAYLADDADISGLMTSVGAQGIHGTQGEFRLLISLAEATGYRQTLISCEELGSLTSGTRVRCTSDYHNFRSDEIGRGPFNDVSFDLTVRDGEIVQARQDFGIEEFSTQMWEPFARWVSKAYPEDAAVMYEDGGTSGMRLTKESIRLWDRHTRDYVAEVGRRADS